MNIIASEDLQEICQEWRYKYNIFWGGSLQSQEKANMYIITHFWEAQPIKPLFPFDGWHYPVLDKKNKYTAYLGHSGRHSDLMG